MKVVVTSDAHGNVNVLKKIAALNPDADFYLDAGDSERCEADIFPFKTVRGNWDYLVTNSFRVDNVGDVTIYTTHGGGFLFNLTHLKTLASNYNANIAVFGHVHHPLVEKMGDLLVINPGSVSIPRKSKASYAVITFSNHTDIKAEIKEIDF